MKILNTLKESRAGERGHGPWAFRRSRAVHAAMQGVEQSGGMQRGIRRILRRLWLESYGSYGFLGLGEKF